jgi:hypothetical protein
LRFAQLRSREAVTDVEKQMFCFRRRSCSAEPYRRPTQRNRYQGRYVPTVFLFVFFGVPQRHTLPVPQRHTLLTESLYRSVTPF